MRWSSSVVTQSSILTTTSNIAAWWCEYFILSRFPPDSTVTHRRDHQWCQHIAVIHIVSVQRWRPLRTITGTIHEIHETEWPVSVKAVVSMVSVCARVDMCVDSSELVHCGCVSCPRTVLLLVSNCLVKLRNCVRADCSYYCRAATLPRNKMLYFVDIAEFIYSLNLN